MPVWKKRRATLSAASTIAAPMTPLIKPGRGGDPPLAADDALVVDVGIQHLAGRWPDGVALQQDLLEADRQDQAEAQDQQQDGHADGCPGW